MLEWIVDILAILLTITMVFSVNPCRKIINMSKEMENTQSTAIHNNRTTYFLDDGCIDKMCDICFGSFENGLVSQCRCGRIFHKECVELTDECPYCRSKTEEMEERPARVPVCPICGNILKDNYCIGCNVIVPDADMSFKCRCGRRLSTKDKMCPECGTGYAMSVEKMKV